MTNHCIWIYDIKVLPRNTVISKKNIDWCIETFGYQPKLVQDDPRGPGIIFQSEQDALLFKLKYNNDWCLDIADDDQSLTWEISFF